MTYGPGAAAPCCPLLFGRLLQLFLRPIGLAGAALARCSFFLFLSNLCISRRSEQTSFCFCIPVRSTIYLMLHCIILLFGALACSQNRQPLFFLCGAEHIGAAAKLCSTIK